jgi:hypothetical protein
MMLSTRMIAGIYLTEAILVLIVGILLGAMMGVV